MKWYIHLIRDLLIFSLSVVFALFLIKINVFERILQSTSEIRFLSVFVAGLFFTSLVTLPVSIVALVELSGIVPLGELVLIGAIGALIGDLILFYSVRGHFSHDFELLSHRPVFERLAKVMHLNMFKWTIPFIGALIIVSPFPDEIGLAMLGIARTKLSALVPISLSMNALGILIIAGFSIIW